MIVSRTDVFATEGDSIVDPAYPYQIFNGTLAAIRSALSSLGTPYTWPPLVSSVPTPGTPTTFAAPASWPPSVSNAGSMPYLYRAGTSGSTIFTTSSRMAARIAAWPSVTKWFINVGVNDANGGSSDSDIITYTTAICDSIANAGQTALFNSPLCSGEKWPTGQNAHDTALENVIDLMRPIVESYGFDYVNLRRLVYDVVEPAYNTPAPGATSGPLCLGDPLGVHPMGTRARVAITDAIMAKITVNT